MQMANDKTGPAFKPAQLMPLDECDVGVRSLGADDVDALHDIMSDFELVHQMGRWPWPADRAFTQSQCKPYAGAGFIWGIFGCDELLGIISVIEGDLECCLKPDARGKGIASHVVRDVVDEAFKDQSLTRITASVWHDNIATAQLLEKISFSQLGQRTQLCLARNEPIPCFKFLLTRTHWDGLRSRREWTIAAPEL